MRGWRPSDVLTQLDLFIERLRELADIDDGVMALNTSLDEMLAGQTGTAVNQSVEDWRARVRAFMAGCEDGTQTVRHHVEVLQDRAAQLAWIVDWVAQASVTVSDDGSVQADDPAYEDYASAREEEIRSHLLGAYQASTNLQSSLRGMQDDVLSLWVES